MRSAHKKWKDFKNRLKAKYFDPEKTNKELWKKHDSRISLKVWKWLVCFWRSEKGKVSAIVQMFCILFLICKTY